ncbi:hemerythrin domain-containing protein [Nocardia farcinica]|uniref:hemerythrin domain-containing protein n=1 Tax=Nocardia farcinica TaxID=37329 RepID=UPI002456E691|nr:hemerythrin domain-containing protein [Nocardia farcinica]
MARSLADQTETELGGARSVLTMQRRDHQDLEALLERIGSSAGDERAAALTELCRLVFPHAFAEEAVLWPLLRRVLPDGEELTLRVEQEHQEINELFTRLETMDVDSREHHLLFARIAQLLREDVRDEEDVLLPKLQEAVGADTLRRIGWAWLAVRRTAHPAAPDGRAQAAGQPRRSGTSR